MLLVDPSWESGCPPTGTLGPTAAMPALAGPAVQVVALAGDAVGLRRTLDAGTAMARNTTRTAVHR